MSPEAANVLIDQKGRFESLGARAAPPPSQKRKWVDTQPCVIGSFNMVRHLTGVHKLSKEDANALVETKARFESVLTKQSAPE
ncbi:hypothetical protein N7486_010225 [Penicillium sp. IBT 16267x]|nr:hypothetical protein N7486_010225 [Penicillium sp. IBT 16267x]